MNHQSVLGWFDQLFKLSEALLTRSSESRISILPELYSLHNVERCLSVCTTLLKEYAQFILIIFGQTDTEML